MAVAAGGAGIPPNDGPGDSPETENDRAEDESLVPTIAHRTGQINLGDQKPLEYKGHLDLVKDGTTTE
jgi:hypothetical protein